MLSVRSGGAQCARVPLRFAQSSRNARNRTRNFADNVRPIPLEDGKVPAVGAMGLPAGSTMPATSSHSNPRRDYGNAHGDVKVNLVKHVPTDKQDVSTLPHPRGSIGHDNESDVNLKSRDGDTANKNMHVDIGPANTAKDDGNTSKWHGIEKALGNKTLKEKSGNLAAKDLMEKMTLAYNTTDVNSGTRLLKLLEDGKRSGACTLMAFNMTLKTLAIQNPEKMEGVFLDMKASGIDPDIFTYNYIISGYATRGKPVEAQTAFDELTKAGLTPTATTYSNLMVAFCKTRTQETYRLDQLITDMQAVPSPEANAALVESLFIDRKYKIILQKLRGLTTFRVPRTLATFHYGLKAAVATENEQAGTQLMRHLRHLRLEPDDICYRSMMELNFNVERYKVAGAYWRTLVCQEHVGPVVLKQEDYYMALCINTLDGNWAEVDAILDLMHEREMLRSETAFRKLLGCLRKGDRKTAISHVAMSWEKLRERGHKADSAYTVMMAMALAKNQCYDRAVLFFRHASDEGEKLSALTLQWWMQSLNALGNIDEALELWRRAQQMGAGSLVEFNLLAVETFAKTNPELLPEVIQVAGKREPYGTKLFTRAIETLTEVGRCNEAHHILQVMWRTSTRTTLENHLHNTVLAACDRRRDHATALAVLNDMDKQIPALSPASQSVPFLVEAFVECGRSKEVITFWDKLQLKNIDVPSSAYPQMAEACYRVQDRKACRNFVHEASKHNLLVDPRVDAYANAREGSATPSAGESFTGKRGVAAYPPRASAPAPAAELRQDPSSNVRGETPASPGIDDTAARASENRLGDVESSTLPCEVSPSPTEGDKARASNTEEVDADSNSERKKDDKNKADKTSHSRGILSRISTLVSRFFRR